MEQALPIKPSSVGLMRWLSIVAMILILFAPRLYGNQKHIEPEVGKSMVSSQLRTSVNIEPRQIAPIEPKADPSLGEMLDEPTGVEIPPSLREEHPTRIPERNPLSVHAKKTEASLQPIILRAANRYQVDPALIKAIIMAESSYNPKAISRRGAKGLMQLMLKTTEALVP